jgi:hypothetical protein
VKTRLAIALSAFALAAFAVTSASAAVTAVSTNWSGYAVGGTTFTAVSGTWIQPAASCTTTGSVTASSFWVGLGGDSSTSNAIEQAGTEADCTANGAVSYSAWYELVPAASVKINLEVSPGDKISAAVKVNGAKVTVQVSNLTTKKSFSKTIAMASPDTSSAEWIAEAPSVVAPGGTQVLPLTNFGTVKFSSAAATTADGHTGPISDPAWTATRIELVTQGAGRPTPFSRFVAAGTAATAMPTTLSSNGRAFSVAWKAGSTVPAGQV